MVIRGSNEILLTPTSWMFELKDNRKPTKKEATKRAITSATNNNANVLRKRRI